MAISSSPSSWYSFSGSSKGFTGRSTEFSTRSLREFRADREKLLRFYEDKKRQEEKEREWERSRTTSLTFEEWEELKWLFNMGYEMNDLKQN